MAIVQTFARGQIEKYLRKMELKFLQDSDGDFLVQFGYDDDYGCEITVYMMAAGKRSDVYSIRINSDKRIPKRDWGQALMLCNTWNKERRWPKAYLSVRDPNNDTTASISLEFDIDLEQGIHQELLDDLTGTIIAGGCQFWEWAHKEQGF